MRPDSYYTRSPDCLDVYGERGANTNVTKFSVRDQAVAIMALVISCVTLGGALVYVYMQHSAIETKITAGTADARAVSNQARTDARLALEKQELYTTRIAVLEDRLNRERK